jgi:hypothetical protein
MKIKIVITPDKGIEEAYGIDSEHVKNLESFFRSLRYLLRCCETRIAAITSQEEIKYAQT